MAFKAFVRKMVPDSVLAAYHWCLAAFAAFWYGYPSRHLVVIGVTGTNGKSTTTHYIGRLLEAAGERVGWTTTVDFKIGSKEWVNDQKMTMLGRFQTQRLLREMLNAGCRYAIVETSSQGIAQFRHVGINYDVAVFTNLTPEHIEAHGGFENYKNAKGKLFQALARAPRKTLFGRTWEKTAVVNVDDDHAGYFLSFNVDKRYGYGTHGGKASQPFIPLIAKQVVYEHACSTFLIDQHAFHLKPIGRFNVYNTLAALATCRALGLDWKTLKQGVAALKPVPGRLEPVDEGQPFSVIVDYAYEPAALMAAYEALALLRPERIIHVMGSAGGGRDVARREELGRLAAQHDDIVIVTNEDPYDDDPMEIVNSVAEGAVKHGKRDGVDLYRILDREEAIRVAISLASPNDLVLLTGKGCEPVMAVADGRKIPWDDRAAARRALRARYAG